MTELASTLDKVWAEVADDAGVTPYVEWIRDHAGWLWKRVGAFSKFSSRGLETAHYWRKDALRKSNNNMGTMEGAGAIQQAMKIVQGKKIPKIHSLQPEPWSVRSKEGTVRNPRPKKRKGGEKEKFRYKKARKAELEAAAGLLLL